MSRTVRTVNCPTCHNAFPQGRGAISVCPRCGERVLVPSLDDEEDAGPRVPESEIASIGVECQLCSSRFYAKPSELGQMMKCPDCHTDNLVVEAPSKAPKKTLAELTDDEDFKLSDPVDTPRYQALTRDALEFERALRSQQGLDVKPLDVDPKAVQAPSASPEPQAPVAQSSGEDELIDLRPADDPPAPASTPVQRETKPIEPSAPAGPDEIELFPEDRMPPAPPARPHAKPQIEEVIELGDDEEESRVEVRVEAPVHRVEYKPVITLPKADKPEDLDDGSEVDLQKLKQSLKGMFSGSGASLPPELARRKPFSTQSLLFFLQPSIIGRCIALAALVLAELWAIQEIMRNLNEGGYAQIIGFFLYLVAFLPGVMAFLLIAMFCFTIVQDTANGLEKIESFPEFSMFSWFESALFFTAAIFVSGMPGALLAGGLLGLGAPTWVSLLLLVSLWLLFPPVLISMLEAGSVMEPISPSMMRSFAPLSSFWIRFYLLSLAIGFIGLMVLSYTFSFGWFTMLPGALILTVLPFIYFRLLGRMAMMYRDYVAATTPDEEEESGPAVRHVIQ